MRPQILFSVLFTLVGAGCHPSAKSNQPTSPPKPAHETDTIRYRSIRAESQAVIYPIGLCDLAKAHSVGAGIYEVSSLINHPVQSPFKTYVDLTLVEAWTPGAPTNPTLLLPGGNGPNGDFMTHDMDLQLGEQAVFLLRPLPGNQEVITGPDGVFKPLGGGYSNGFLFTRTPETLSGLRTAVRAIYQALAVGGACPFDIPPDVGVATGPKTPRGDDVVHIGDFVLDTTE